VSGQLLETLDGGARILIPEAEREVIAEFAADLARWLQNAGSREPFFYRLLPPASLTDPALAESFRELTGDEILTGHIEGLRRVAAEIEADFVPVSRLEGWLPAINVMRLFLATVLDLDEKGPTVTRTKEAETLYSFFGYLSVLQEEALAVVSGGQDG
jgi:hypothetical protein